MPQRIRDYGVAALVLGLLLGVLTRIDQRVPDRVMQAASDVVNGRWKAPDTPLGSFLVDAASNPALDNMFVLALLAASVVLVFLMVRT